jgi:1-phosphofructokinase family hexose kinase
MTKIHTVTLNPAIDIRHGKRYAGGKGINVSRALHNLRVQDVLTYTLVGGERGEELLYLMEKAGLDYVVQETKEETRQTEIVQGWPEIKRSSRSPEVHGSETGQLVEKLRKNVSKGDYVVLAGSLPAGVNHVIYGYLISNLQAKGAKVILDSSQTDALKHGMRQKPFAMKPNEQEWRAVTEEDTSIAKVLEEMSKAHNLEYAIAMQGPEGLTLVNSGGAIKATPPEITVGSTVGSGDAVTAGFLYGKLHNFVDESLARFATACGTASAKKEGTELCNLDDACDVASEVEVRNI